MGVPCFRHSPSRRDKRRTHHTLKRPASVLCPNCGAARKPHHACPGCGYVRPGLTVRTTGSE